MRHISAGVRRTSIAPRSCTPAVERWARPPSLGQDQETGQISAAGVPSTDKATLRDFAEERVAPEAEVFTDNHGGYEGMGNRRTVKHSIGEYVSDQAHLRSA